MAQAPRATTLLALQALGLGRWSLWGLAALGLVACSIRLDPTQLRGWYGLGVSGQEAMLPEREGSLLLSLTQEPGGNPLGPVEVVHEKPFHVFIASSDLRHFAHVHPDVDPSLAAFGPLGVKYTPSQAGSHQVWVDFTPKGGFNHVVGMPFQVAGEAPASPPPLVKDDLSLPKLVDGYQVFLAKEPTGFIFTLRHPKGIPTLQPYLGADGHAIAVREGSLDLVHAHPTGKAEAGQLTFQAAFPGAGLYKIWGEFMPDGQFIRVPFVVEVNQAEAALAPLPHNHLAH